MAEQPKASDQVKNGNDETVARPTGTPARAKISKVKRTTDVIKHRGGGYEGTAPPRRA